VTSGQISRSSSLLEVVSANANFFTLLPLGIGIEANIPLLTEVARMSYGYAEFEMSQDRLQVALKAKKTNSTSVSSDPRRSRHGLGRPPRLYYSGPRTTANRI
jgi:hypothetical protein